MPAGAVIVLTFLILIPISAIVANALRNMKEREALHEERLKAIEMGQTEIPRALLSTPEEVRTRRGRGPAVHGVVWTGIGLGLLASTYALQSEAQNTEFREFLLFLKIWAFPALFVGLGLLGYTLFTHNEKAPATTEPAPSPR
jgi:hypothetical protein